MGKEPDRREELAWYQTPEFLAQRKKWYGKLQRSGFKELEFIDWETGESGDLPRWGSVADLSRAYKEDSERYYQVANQYLWVMRQHNSRSRFPKGYRPVWRRHCAGKSNAQIAREMGLSQDVVGQRVDEVRERMLAWYQSPSYSMGGDDDE